MAASKRNFDDFHNFPGSLTDLGYYSFPALWHKDDAGRWRVWQIHVRLVKDEFRLNGIDWSLLDEKQLPIKDPYFTSAIDSTIVAQVWAESGIESGKITRSAPTYVTEPVNKGKANERNVFQQALVIARSLWQKRKDKGDSEEKQTTTSNMPFPQLAKSYKDAQKYIKYPIYIQPKLDGVRCIMFLKKKNGGYKNVIAYTRTKKVFPSIDYLRKEIYPYLNALFEDGHSIYLDGELYRHGKKLQDISGDSRNENTDQKADDRNEYHVYDCFYLNELAADFKMRYAQLENIFNNTSSDLLKLVPTKLATSSAEVNKEYAKFLKQGYEGAILRNSAGVYAFGTSKTGTRSNDLIKLKPKFSDEFECVGYTQGDKGKDVGAVIWICQTKDKQQFNVTPKDITYEERYALFQDCEASFKKKYYLRMLSVEYEDLSKTGIPQRAKALTFRDYE